LSVFTQPNQDATSVAASDVATGPKVGFLEAYRASIDAQMRASSMFGIEYYMSYLDNQQTQVMRDAGIPDAPQLLRALQPDFDFSFARDDDGYFTGFSIAQAGEYMDVARAYSGDAPSEKMRNQLNGYDARILRLRETNADLGLRTSRELFGEVKRRAREAEAKINSDRNSFGGHVGSFVGSALSSMHPQTDPLNFWTLGVGGAGKTALQRIATQVGAQGAIETVNQITGVQEQRLILGVSHGFGDAAMRVGATALGAGALQGLGEGAVALGRRWFRSTQADPAPPVPAPDPPRRLPPPENATPEDLADDMRLQARPETYIDDAIIEAAASVAGAAKVKAADDLADAMAQLSDYAGPFPGAMRPRATSTAVPARVDRPRVEVAPALRSNSEYQAARAQDEASFVKYEKLLERRNVYRRWLDETRNQTSADKAETLAKIDARLDGLTKEFRRVQGKGNKTRVRAQIRDARADKEALLAVPDNVETPGARRIRQDTMKNDEKMRDLAPLIGRAYARSRGEWGVTDPEVDAVWDAYLEGRPRPENPPGVRMSYDEAVQMMQPVDRMPALARATPDQVGKTDADTLTAVARADGEVADAAVEAFRAQAARMVASTERETLTVDGIDVEIPLTARVEMPGPDGEPRMVTVRDLMKQMQRDSDEIAAVSTCSINKTS